MKKNTKKTLIFLLAVFLLLGSGHLYLHMTGDFQKDYLLPSGPYPHPVTLPTLPAEEISRAESIFRQGFYYLGHGNQTYVFGSDDGRYVLKLFKKDYLKRTWVKHLIPPIFPIRSLFLYSGAGKESREKKLLNGYTAAYTYARDLAGLLYFHLNQDMTLTHTVTLRGGLGVTYEIKLGDYVFALQERATTTKVELSRLLSEGELEEAKKRICQLLELYRTGYRRGIQDLDYNFLDNTGFVGQRAIRQDVGKIILNPAVMTPDGAKQDLNKVVEKRLKPWIRKRYPKYYPELVDAIEACSTQPSSLS